MLGAGLRVLAVRERATRTRSRHRRVVAFARVERAGAAAAVVHMLGAPPGLLLSVDRGGAAAVRRGAFFRVFDCRIFR